MKVFVWWTMAGEIGVYSTREKAETLGRAKGQDIYGIDGHVSEYDLDDIAAPPKLYRCLRCGDDTLLTPQCNKCWPT